MVKIPFIKIPSVRVGSIGLTSNIGTGGATPAPPTPITYLTQWKIVGNSEVHTLPYPDGVVLPNGYKRCKYLEAHGTEYIELPIGFDNTDEIELTASFTQINLSDKYAIAPKTWNDNDNRFAMGIHYVNIQEQKSQYLFCIGYGSARTSNTVYTPYVSQDTNVHLFTYANYLFKLDNSSTRDVSSITFGGTTNNLNLFYGYNSPTKCRIYSYHQVKEDETEINLIPCLDDNNVPCLYDTVSGTAFYNIGTGTFGYEIEPQPTEIWSCGEYSDVDNKYHVVILPAGKQGVDIVLNEPLRKTGNTADTLEYPTETSGKALLTTRVEESGGELLPLDTPTTELVDAPQIEEAESYTCEISQGGKAVEWSSFTTNSE